MSVRVGVAALLLLGGVLYAQDDLHEEIKYTLRSDMTLQYSQLPHEVDTLGEMFTQGILYGRLRFNSFGFKWGEELSKGDVPIRKDNAIAAIGGSLLYRSGVLNGVWFGGGLYATTSAGNLEREESYLYKSGKDAFSRYDRLKDGTVGILTLAQGYLAYTHAETTLKAGRQIFESFLTKSNDSKMIPNTFEGVTLDSKVLPQTDIKAAYLTRQKLRDHSTFHHLFAYGYNPDEPYSAYSQNDDSSMHIGLTLDKLEAAGIDDRLVVLDVHNHSVENLALWGNYTLVPDLISYAMIEADYGFDLGSWRVVPGIRYMQQSDEGAAAIIGPNAASRRLLTTGYKNPQSLDASMFGARIDLKHERLKLRLGYTDVADKADMITPWRGFPTSGFTRVMGQNNWYANTKSYMLQVKYDTGFFDDLSLMGRFAYQDFDDSKPGVQADSNVLTLDVMKGFGSKSHLYAKMRYGHVWGEDDTPIAGSPGKFKLDPSYDEIRFEINYLF